MISGTVGDSGQVSVTVSHGAHSATGTGHLSSHNGGGKWTSDGCSGTWTAQRRNNGRVVAYQ